MKHLISKNILLNILVSLIYLYASDIHAEFTRNYVRSIPSIKWKQPKTKDFIKKEIDFFLLENNKYTLNEWYYNKMHFKKDPTEILNFGGNDEAHIRPVSHHIFALALSLKTGVYDSHFTLRSNKEAKKVLIQLIKSVSYCHKTNNPAGSQTWGNQWQSALWAAQIAEGAWFVWDWLDEEEKELVSKMIIYEADRFINYHVPYYKDYTGKIIFQGDTKAEENAWNSNILTIAIAMMPKHPHLKQWSDKNFELQISAYATPEDINCEKKVDGIPLNKILKGSNMNSDGTVVNHRIIHPDYMSAIMLNVTNAWIFELADLKPLMASIYNGDKIYMALTQEKFNGETIYQTTPNGKASCLLYFPQGNDWGGERQANYWLLDIMAHIYHWDENMSIKAIDWIAVRGLEMKRMFLRDTTGQYYQEKAEDNFPSREEWIGSHVAWALLGWWLHH